MALARSGQLRVSVMDYGPEALQSARRLFARQSVAAEFLGLPRIVSNPLFGLR